MPKQPDPPKPHQCHHLVVNKNRYCPLRISDSSSQKFCPNHDPAKLAERVPCPVDPTHTVFIKDLSKHAKKCSRPTFETCAFYSCDVNLPRTNPVEKPKLSELPLAQLSELFDRIRKCFSDVDKHSIPYKGPLNLTDADSAFEGVSETKSVRQIKALLGIMDNHSLLSKDDVFVEMGCGTAELSHFLNKTIRKRTSSSKGNEAALPRFILVDRETSRWKVKMNEGHFEKIRIDIKDLVLQKCKWLDAEKVSDNTGGVVCISKHLCGAATDLALRCFFNYTLESRPTRLRAIQIALCCHHRCTFESYIHPNFITDHLKFSPTEFSFLCQISSWGASPPINQLNPKKRRKLEGLKDAANQTPNEELDSGDDEHHAPDLDEDSSTQLHFSRLNQEQRRELGRMAKALLNEGRLRFLRETLGCSTAQVVEYTSCDVTPENTVLLGVLE
ncbi:methyltransferase TRM13-domain-containing protein [Chytriomyces cf. hyalinus JEL632]|nr:methyltransferase TRM13-domain-containing protein [Chytriomyces cf. hyalinus JEL632]